MMKPFAIARSGAMLMLTLTVGCTDRAPGNAAAVPKNLRQLQEIKSTPRACHSGVECPAGSYCDVAKGRCNWECYASSDCGGFTCSADGHCTDVRRASPLAAQRVATPAVVTDGGRPASCAYTEDCNGGYYCDQNDHACKQDCLPGGGTGCPIGKSCDAT